MTDRIDFGGRPWTAIPREVLRDSSLSPKAKGGLVSLLSHQEGWLRSVIATLQKDNACGRTEAKTIMRELSARGYATLVQTNGRGGRFTSAYTVHAIRQVQASEPVISPGTDAPTTDAPGSVALSAVVDALPVEPKEEEPKAVSLAPPRPRDPIWDVLVTAYGQPTASGKGAMNAACKVLRDYGADDGEIAWMIRKLEGTDLSWAVVTPSSLAKHFGERDALISQLDRSRVYDHAAAIAEGHR